jgi:hypothetical protein
MTNIKYFSDNIYLFLPTSKSPKVVLAIDNCVVANNSYKLYNPFSKKAKFLKSCTFRTLWLLRYLPSVQKIKKSEFIKYLEKRLSQEIISSIYYATDQDKVVLQIQSKNRFNIIGYLKIAVNKRGNDKILNEIYAINELRMINIISNNYIIFNGIYENKSFVFLKELSGEAVSIDKVNILELLRKLYRSEKYFLYEHPRVIELRGKLKKQNKNELLVILNKIIKKSDSRFSLVYEHGDFSPWNILNYHGKYQLFDFEYFNKDGLEYIDMIKYNYQVGYLLKKLDFVNLKLMIKSKIKHKDFEVLYTIFLISEISKELEENINTRKLNDLLKQLI